LRSPHTLRRRVAVALAAVSASALLLIPSASAPAATGGAGPTGSASSKPGKAKLRNGRAVAPSNAPSRIRKAIAAGNKIRNKPYKWGGGHGRWNDSGYDCSGAVSYILHAAGMLSRPKDSGALARWGRKGKGRWITVMANSGHTYIVVAGLRMDTSGTGGSGPSWHRDAFTGRNGPYKMRHFNSKY
jgi:NlpC/P60 family